MEIFSENVIGLDIGSSSVKAVKLKKTNEGYEITGAEIVSVLSDSIENVSPDLRHSLYVDAVKKILRAKNMTGKKIVTSVLSAENSTIIRYVGLPYMTEDELKNQMPHQLEQYVPIAQDQIAYDYKVVTEYAEDSQKKMLVLIVAVKNDSMNQHMSILKDAGFSPQAIDVDPLALCNAYTLNAEEETSELRLNTVALINIGAKSTILQIVEKNVPRFTKDISLAGNNFTKDIMREFQLDFPQAEELKKQQARILVESEETLLDTVRDANDEKVIRINDAMKSSLNKLFQEIRRGFEYYENNNKKQAGSVQKILLSGGSSRIQNIDKFLAEKLSIPVEINYPFKNVNIDSKNFDLDNLRLNAVQFNIALGLAIRKVGV